MAFSVKIQPAWQATRGYSAGDFVSYQGGLYIATAGNVGVVPTNASYWASYGGGAPGAPGVGVPTGGATGQVLAKKSTTAYDTEWVDILTAW
jgi:chitodextrinase